MRRGQGWPAHAALVLLAAVCLYGLPFAAPDRFFYDTALRLRSNANAAPPVDPLVVVVAIDDRFWMQWSDTDQQMRGMASLLRALRDIGCEVVVLDGVFAHGNAEQQRPLFEAIRDLGPEHVVLGAIDAAEAVATVPAWQSQLAGWPTGMVNVPPSHDGVLRQYALFSPTSSRPSLALSAYLTLRQIPPTDLHLGTRTVRWSELSADGRQHLSRQVPRTVALDFRAPWIPPPAGEAAAFRHIDAAEVLSLAQQQRWSELQGCVAVVAFSGLGAGDVGTTPLDRSVPRVVLHLQAINDLIQDSWHVVAPAHLQVLLSLLVLLLALTLSRLQRFRWLLLGWLGTMALLLGGGGWLVWRRHVVLDVATAAIFCTLSLLVEIVTRYASEAIERQQLRHVMGYYFSPRVLEQVLRTPGALEAQQADVVMLLTDLRNFTAMSERLGPQQLFLLLNRVFEVQTEAVMAEDGSLEHFLGDQFLSYWGAPGAQPDAADRALRAANALLGGMQRLRETLDPAVTDLFGWGVALHAGPVLIGNKGSARRLDYGLVGDSINSAARVESLTKTYGVPLLMTREVFVRLSQPPLHRVVDRVLAVGKSQAHRRPRCDGHDYTRVMTPKTHL
jgi:adenylate cyclase